MTLRYLRKARLIVSICFFVLLAVLFLDVGNRFPQLLKTALVSLQLIPSFLNTFVVVGATVIGLLLVVLLTVVFGRVYCSSICPLGTLQDVIIFLSNRRKGKRRFRYKKSPDRIHYAVLVGTALFLIGGSLTAINLLDPFSNFGRMMTNIVRPVILSANNAVAWALDHVRIYVLYYIPVTSPEPGVILFSLVFLGFVAYLCYDQGRLFCNLLCPVGALLKFVSRYSAFRIVIDPDTCKEWGLCE